MAGQKTGRTTKKTGGTKNTGGGGGPTASSVRHVPPAITFHDEDRCVEIRLRKKAHEAARTILLDEPSLTDLGKIESIVKRVDAEMPQVPAEPNGEVTDDDERMRLNQERDAKAKEQGDWLHGDEETPPPYAVAFLEMVHLLTDEDVALEDLPPGTAHWATLGKVLGFYRLPLPGLAVTSLSK